MRPGRRCAIFCTFAGVNFLDENAPESRNLHIKFQTKFRVTPPAITPIGRSDSARGKHPQCSDTNCDAVGRPVLLSD